MSHKNWISIFSTSIFFLLIMMQPIHQIGHIYENNHHHCDSHQSNSEFIIHSDSHCDVCDFQFAKPVEITFDQFDLEFAEFPQFKEISSEIQSQHSSNFTHQNYLRGPPKIA